MVAWGGQGGEPGGNGAGSLWEMGKERVESGKRDYYVGGNC